MFRLATITLLVALSAAAAQPPRELPPRVAALTKEYQGTRPALIAVLDKTRDAASRTQVVVVHAEGGEKVALRPGMEVYFRIDAGKNEFTKSGGWYWSAGGGLEQSRLRGATEVKAVRDPAGYVDWYRVERRK